MSEFVKVTAVSQIKENSGSMVEIHGIAIAIFKREGEFFAVNNVCSHQHFSVLHRGVLDGCTVECPMHGWTYDLRTGNALKGEGRITRYNVEVRGEYIFVELPDQWIVSE